VVSDGDPARLLEKLRAANQGGDVHLVGGPRTIETFRALGALDKVRPAQSATPSPQPPSITISCPVM
jgi:hypothetical protein